MAEVTLSFEGVRAILLHRHEVALSEVRVGPGEVVGLTASPDLGAAVADLIAGRGLGRVLDGRLDLGGEDMLRMTSGERQRRGLFVPEVQAAPFGRAQAFQRLVGDVNQVRRLQGRRPVPTLTALLRTGVDRVFARTGVEMVMVSQDLSWLLHQVRLAESPLAVITVREGLRPTELGLLGTAATYSRMAGRGLLILGAAEEVVGAVGGYTRVSSIEVLEVLDMAG